MKKSFLMYKRIARLSGIVAVLAVTVFAIPSTVIVSSAEAATVTSGSCTATVDNATGVVMTVASNGDCVLSFATAPTTPTTSTESATRTWTVPASVSSVQALVVAGGGGGGHNIMTKKRSTKQSGSDQGSGNVYSSKHVRLLEARRNNNNKTPTTKSQKVGGRK